MFSSTTHTRKVQQEFAIMSERLLDDEALDADSSLTTEEKSFDLMPREVHFAFKVAKEKLRRGSQAQGDDDSEGEANKGDDEQEAEDSQSDAERDAQQNEGHAADAGGGADGQVNADEEQRDKGVETKKRRRSSKAQGDANEEDDSGGGANNGKKEADAQDYDQSSDAQQDEGDEGEAGGGDDAHEQQRDQEEEDEETETQKVDDTD